MDVKVEKTPKGGRQGTLLICPDAQAKLDKLPIGQNHRRYRVSYTLLLKLSLGSQSLSAKDHIVNILLALMVDLLLFP